MTKEEFIERKNAIDRGPKWLNTFFFLAYFCAIFSWNGIKQKSDELNDPVLSYSVSNPVGLFAASFFSYVILVGMWNKRRIRQEGLLCAQCAELMTDPLAKPAIATGNRGQCGHSAFDDPNRMS